MPPPEYIDGGIPPCAGRYGLFICPVVFTDASCLTLPLLVVGTPVAVDAPLFTPTTGGVGFDINCSSNADGGFFA